MKYRISDTDCQFAVQGEGLGPASFVKSCRSSGIKTFALPIPHLAPTLPLATVFPPTSLPHLTWALNLSPPGGGASWEQDKTPIGWALWLLTLLAPWLALCLHLQQVIWWGKGGQEKNVGKV